MLRAAGVLDEQIVVGPDVLHFLLRDDLAEYDALADIVSVLPQEGLLLLEF